MRVKCLGRSTLLLVLAGADCSGSPGASGDGGSAGASGSAGAAGIGGGAGSGGAAGDGRAGAAGTGSGGAVGGGTGGGGTGAGGINPSCIRSDAQLHKFLNLDVRGESFADHNGETLYLITRSGSSGIIGTGKTLVSAGGFAVHFEGGYERNTSQQLLWFADADGDGNCNLSKGDHIGYVSLGPFDPVANDALTATIADNHVMDIPGETSPCSGARPFGDMLDMNVSASGFQAHEGSSVYMLTRTFQNGAVFGRGQTAVASGRFAFNFPRGFARQAYQEVFWFVDLDGDGLCTTTSDHLGYAVTAAFSPTGNQPLDMTITDNHAGTSARGADVCIVMNGCPIAP